MHLRFIVIKTYNDNRQRCSWDNDAHSQIYICNSHIMYIAVLLSGPEGGWDEWSAGSTRLLDGTTR